MNKNLVYLIKYLLSERSDNMAIPQNEAEQFRLYRSLVNIRPAQNADEKYLRAEDGFLTELITEKGITDIADMKPAAENIYLWQGDITTLKWVTKNQRDRQSSPLHTTSPAIILSTQSVLSFRADLPMKTVKCSKAAIFPALNLL